MMLRVNYDKRNWDMIATVLTQEHDSIHVVNRAQAIDDALNLAKSDLVDYETALSMTEYLHNEQDYVPWKAALNGRKSNNYQNTTYI